MTDLIAKLELKTQAEMLDEIIVLRKALERIAKQQLPDERLVEGGDYEYGYEQIVKIAREAISPALRKGEA